MQLPFSTNRKHYIPNSYLLNWLETHLLQLHDLPDTRSNNCSTGKSQIWRTLSRIQLPSPSQRRNSFAKASSCMLLYSNTALCRWHARRRQRAPLLIVSLVGVAGGFVYLKARAVKQRSEEAKRASSKDRFIVTTARSGEYPSFSWDLWLGLKMLTFRRWWYLRRLGE